MTVKRCYCGSPLRADGFCVFRCDPALKPSVLRAAATKAKREARRARVDSESHGITHEVQRELAVTMAKIDPVAKYKLGLVRNKKR